MREIKFRLRIDNKIIGYEKWYQGHDNEDDPCSANPCWLYSKDGEKWFPKYLYHKQKDSYTNLKDKNGKEIYEGDILEGGNIVEFGYQEEVFNGFISMGDGEEDNDYISVCGMYLKDEDGEYETLSNYLDTYNKLKIIGNIYENPELLK